LPNFEKSSAKENGAKENYITYIFICSVSRINFLDNLTSACNSKRNSKLASKFTYFSKNISMFA
jgi:hypothetical protein